MIMKKFAGLLTAAVLTALTLAGCASSGASGSADATAEHPLVLNLAHNQMCIRDRPDHHRPLRFIWFRALYLHLPDAL